jgi:hypothetical protein
MEKEKCKTTNKRRYHDRGVALKTLLNIKSNIRNYDQISNKRLNRRVGRRSETRVYFCSDCKGYHITSIDYKVNFKTIKKTIDERRRNTNDCYLTKEAGTEWKKDSLPFPIDKIKK